MLLLKRMVVLLPWIWTDMAYILRCRVFLLLHTFIVGLRMGFERMDVFTGITRHNLKSSPSLGLGFFLIDYAQIQPYVFSGLMVQEMDNVLM